jgi:fatty-acyl-CoA synthase
LGTPVRGTEVEIRMPDGRVAEPGRGGEIWVGGASVSAGYIEDTEATTATFRDGWCRTGDSGVMVGDELVFLGRGDDRLSANGRNYYAEDLEAALVGLRGVGVGSAIVLTETAGTTRRVTVLWESRLAEREASEAAAAMAARVSQEVGGDVAIRVLAVDRGAIPRTTSGKVRREAAAARVAAGELAGRLLASIR